MRALGTIFPSDKNLLSKAAVMEELHKIHKDVPYGYWVLWVVPAWRFLTRKWRDRPTGRALPAGLDQPSAPH